MLRRKKHVILKLKVDTPLASNLSKMPTPFVHPQAELIFTVITLLYVH